MFMPRTRQLVGNHYQLCPRHGGREPMSIVWRVASYDRNRNALTFRSVHTGHDHAVPLEDFKRMIVRGDLELISARQAQRVYPTTYRKD